MKLKLIALPILCSLFCSVALMAQDTKETLIDRANREFRNGDWKAAESDLREIAKQNPDSILVNFFLGESMFRQQRYAEAATFFQTARDRQKKGGNELNTMQDRILTDELVMSYGISGEVKKTYALLDEAIAKDPDYPLNYYNRACAFAEEGEKTKMLANLDLAFQRKANMIKGEQFPDPLRDSSFQKYLRDPDFVSPMKKLGVH